MKRTFTFSINQTGKVEYVPEDPGKWKYKFDDELIFQTHDAAAGPFRITFIHTQGYAQLPHWPPDPLESDDKGPPYSVTVRVRDGLSRSERRSIWEGNRDASPDSLGFIGKYKYKIEKLNGSSPKLIDDQHNGQYDC
jgi:hypothetical protein